MQRLSKIPKASLFNVTEHLGYSDYLRNCDLCNIGTFIFGKAKLLSIIPMWTSKFLTGQRLLNSSFHSSAVLDTKHCT